MSGLRHDGGRDRTTVRRALRAGAATWAVVGGSFLAAVVVGGGDGRAGLAAVLLGLTFAGFVASGWLLLATFLDLLAGDRPGGYRLRWIAAVVAFTFISPLLLIGARA